MDERATRNFNGVVCRYIYETGIWPEDFTKIVLIPIPKKAKAVLMI